MSQVISLTGSDTLKLNDRIISDVADGDIVAITYPNDLANVKTGKNGNSIISFKNDGRQADVSIRVMLGSSDDKFLNNLLSLFKNDPAAFALIFGEFTKNTGDGTGKVTQTTYVLSGGIPSKNVDTTENADGNTDQAIAVYNFKFTNAPRSIG